MDHGRYIPERGKEGHVEDKQRERWLFYKCLCKWGPEGDWRTAGGYEEESGG